MPTGYTADIAKGITFPQFAMNCARAFGACLTLRDEAVDGEAIPEHFEPSDYHLTQLDIARTNLADLESMSDEEAETHCKETYQMREANRLKCLQENNARIASYWAMLELVRGWTPPSDDHEELREFMQKQIEESIKFDDNRDYYQKPIAPQSAEDWLEVQKSSALKSIEYHKSEYAKEVERTNQRNEWIRLLRDSLK